MQPNRFPRAHRLCVLLAHCVSPATIFHLNKKERRGEIEVVFLFCCSPGVDFQMEKKGMERERNDFSNVTR